MILEKKKMINSELYMYEGFVRNPTFAHMHNTHWFQNTRSLGEKSSPKVLPAYFKYVPFDIDENQLPIIANFKKFYKPLQRY